MAGILDPFNPGTDNTPFAGIDPGMFDNLRQQWSTFLDDPRGRAAIMSAGLALTQPPSFGDNALSQIGRAVGAAGQSGALMQAQDLKQSELESKDAERESRAGLRESQGMLAEARAATAGVRADSAADRLKFQREKLATDMEYKGRVLDSQERERQSRAELRVAQAEALAARTGTQEARNELAQARLDLQKIQQQSMTDRNVINNQVRVSNMYQNYVRDVAKRNADPLNMARPGFTPEPVLPINDWVQRNPLLRDSGILPSTDTESGMPDVPAAADTTSRPVLSPQDQQALAWANANPNDPRAAQIKARLGVR